MNHAAVVTIAPRAPLELRQVPTPKPRANQVRVRNEWTSTQPFDMHKADGGLLAQYPDVTGDGCVGTVVKLGDQVKRLKVGDKVFGYTWRSQEERGHQTYVVAPENLLAKIPPGISPEAATTVPTNFVTVFHTLISSLNLSVPWPKPPSYTPPAANTAILIWGGSSSVGQYAIQILSYYGYKNLIAVSSSRYHNYLLSIGATRVFDYNHSDIVNQIRNQVGTIPYFFDCIGSGPSSIKPISDLAKQGSKVAVLLPVVLSPSTPTIAPEYGFDVSAAAAWAEGVEVTGIRTHSYLENEFLAKVLQPEIMPALLENGAVKPNKYRIVEGEDMLDRAQKALQELRKGVSGEKLVWRVSDV